MLFKTVPCKNQSSHNPKKCFYYHEAKTKDQRRAPNSYVSELCDSVLTQTVCSDGDGCHKCHNRVEEFYHPEKYKSKFCATYPDNIDLCDYGEMCAFAHAESELTVPQLDKMERDSDFYMFHFKTAWCPFSDKEHQRDQCVYAHNWQDYRRPPHVFEYSNSKCQSWETKKNTRTYGDGCRLEYRCGQCHGCKELEYHPACYKTSECRIPVGGSCRKSHCPFYHSEKDRRMPQTNPYFKLFPRNRGSAHGHVYSYAK